MTQNAANDLTEATISTDSQWEDTSTSRVEPGTAVRNQ